MTMSKIFVEVAGMRRHGVSALTFFLNVTPDARDMIYLPTAPFDASSSATSQSEHDEGSIDATTGKKQLKRRKNIANDKRDQSTLEDILLLIRIC